LDAQLQRSAAAICSGSADLGEVIATAGRIVPGDYDNWYSEWAALAEKTTQLASKSLQGGHQLSASKAFLRATEYWRQAIFFLRHDTQDPRLQNGWRSHRAAFRAALPLLPWKVTITALPFESGLMTTYLLRPDGSETRRPTVLIPCGFDSTAEASYAGGSYMALPRGYNVVRWDGPGQGGMLCEYGIPMRPDFESVVSPLIDWLLMQPGSIQKASFCEKRFHRFTASEGADGHCCGMGVTLWENVAFDWIDEVLGWTSKPKKIS
jgi:hypothetical protein